MGVIIGHKIVPMAEGTCPVVLVVLRGGGYEKEWGGNFLLEDKSVNGSDHAGFSKAKQKAFEYLKAYIEEEVEKGRLRGHIKLWITGYSRAAATANMLAGELLHYSSLADGVLISPDEIYAYCFETPMGVSTETDMDSSDYRYIHNIINPNDPVTMVAPRGMGYGRYGVDKVLPDKTTEKDYFPLFRDMLTEYQSIFSDYRKWALSHPDSGSMLAKTDYVIGDFTQYILCPVIHTEINPVLPIEPVTYTTIEILPTGPTPMAEFFRDFFANLTSSELLTRENYTTYCEQLARDLVGGCILGESKEKADAFIGYISSNIDWPKVICSYLGAHDKTLSSYVAKLVLEGLMYADISLNEILSKGELYEIIHNALVDTSPLRNFLISNANMVITLFNNSDIIWTAHYPELCLAWMQSFDSNFVEGDVSYFDYSKSWKGKYRTVAVNCPVDVELFHENGERLAAIIDDAPQSIPNSTIIAKIALEGYRNSSNRLRFRNHREK